MKSNVLYLIAVILIIGWLMGLAGYVTSGIIHILLILAIVSVVLY